MSTDPRYQEVTQMIRAGNKANARQLIKLMLRDNPNSADAWYLAAAASDGEQQRTEALKRALAIDPNHERARSALTQRATIDVGAVNATEADEQDEKPSESTLHFIVRVLLSIVALLAGLFFSFMAYSYIIAGATYTVDIGDVVLALRAIFFLIAAIAAFGTLALLSRKPS